MSVIPVAGEDSAPTALMMSSLKICWMWKQLVVACKVLDGHFASDDASAVASTQSVLNVGTMLLTAKTK